MRRRRAVTTFETAQNGPLLFVQYDEARRPFGVLTRSRYGAFNEHDFEWCRRDRVLCTHQSGSTPAREVEAHRPYWAAEGVVVREMSADAVRLGAPRGDPFANAREEYVVHCVACRTAMPDCQPCGHLFEDRSGEVRGPGSDCSLGLPDYVLPAVRALGCERVLLAELRRMKARPAPARWTCRVRRLVDTYARRLGASRPPRRFWERLDDRQNTDGVVWLASLDACTVKANQLLLDALAREVEAQNARRQSGAKAYRVWAEPGPDDGLAEWGPPFRRHRRDPDGLVPHTPIVSWQDALTRAREIRATGPMRGAIIRRKAPTEKTR